MLGKKRNSAARPVARPTFTGETWIPRAVGQAMFAERIARRIATAVFSLLLAAGAPALAIDRGVSGLWYNPAQSGHGFELTVVEPATVAVTWYTYNANGAPVWVSGVLNETAPGVLSGNVSYYHGMVFGQFLPAENVAYAWGSLRFTFLSCNTARVEYNGTLRYQDGSGFGAGVLQVQKLAGVQDVTCGAVASQGLAGLYLGGIRSSASGQDRAAFALLENGGTATIMVPGDVAYFGTYSSDSSSVSFILNGQTVLGSSFPDGGSTATASGSGIARAADFLRGNYSSAGSTGPFNFLYLGLSTRSPSLSAMAGSYVDLSGETSLSAAVTATGSVTGRDASGCQFTGAMIPIAATLNAFNLSVTVVGCGAGNGTYSGKAMVADIQEFGDSRGLAIALRGPNNAIAGLLHRN